MVNLLVGSALGFLSGLGVGGGSLLLLWLTLAVGMDPSQARALNLMFFLPSAAISTALRWRKSRPEWKRLLPAAAAGLLGAVLGNLIAPALNRDALEKAFGVLFLLSGLRELCRRPK